MIVRQLVRVLPLAQTQVQGGVELTLLSLEAYTDGFFVTLRLVPAEERPLLPESRSYPDLALHATDERGARYDAWPVGGSGYPDHWRFTFSFVPPLNSAVQELRLEVPELRWRSFREGEPPVEAPPGPWAFVVPLHGEEHGEP
jgi:hypothetical protein